MSRLKFVLIWFDDLVFSVSLFFLNTIGHYEQRPQTDFFFMIKAALGVFSPGQTHSQVDASQHKFAKPELAYGIAKGAQTVLKSARKSQKAVDFTFL